MVFRRQLADMPRQSLKHYGVWCVKVRLGLPDAAIAAQAGWSEAAVTKMVGTYAHAVDERRLEELDRAFDRLGEGWLQ